MPDSADKRRAIAAMWLRLPIGPEANAIQPHDEPDRTHIGMVYRYGGGALESPPVWRQREFRRRTGAIILTLLQEE